MKTATDQATRPQYYDGQYLGADDIEAALSYARLAQARHTLGAHLWGIAIGLDLAERVLTGDDVELLLTPGVAWDGYARAVVAPVPERLAVDLFANLQDDTDATGIPLEIWITYRELQADPPRAGFACPGDTSYGRVVETYRIEVRRAAIVDRHSVTIANRSFDATQALTAFDATKGPLHDESAPEQTFPEDGDRSRWPIFVGIARWRKDPGQPGRLIKRTLDDRIKARSGRRYLGAVAETIVAPDGVLRLRDRANDPTDPVVNFKPPSLPSAAGTAVNDLVWCEGHLRVVGDARLQDGKLDYRVARGGDDGVPMFLRRAFVNTPIPKTTLDAFIGPPAPGPSNAQTRFAVSSADAAGQPKECLTVVTDGRVGVNAADPTNTLQVEGPSGIRHGYGYVTGDKGAAWAGFAFNAYANAGTWVLADAAHQAAAVVLDDSGGVPEIKVQTSSNTSPPAWTVHVVVKGDTGNVGIHNVAPAAKLHVSSPAVGTQPAQGEIKLFSPLANFEYRGESNKAFVFQDTGGKTAFLGGDIGIGTVAPLGRFHVAKAGHLNAVFDSTSNNEHLTAVVGAQVSGLRFSESNEFFIGSQPYGNRADSSLGNEHLRLRPNGDLGVGTSVPQDRLHVASASSTRITVEGTAGGYAGVRARTNLGEYFSGINTGTSRWCVVDNNAQAERLSITATGNVGINTTNPSYRLDVAGSLRVTGSAYKVGTTWSNLSDQRLKKDIKPIANPLEKLLGLRGVGFAWRHPERLGVAPGRYLGFIAQEVERVFPEWIETTPAGDKAIQAVGLEALVVEAVRELSSRCDQLESEVTRLRAQLAGGSEPPAQAARAKAPGAPRKKT